MGNELVRSHFGLLAEQGVWASLYTEPGAKVTAETWSFLIRARRVIELLQSSGRELREVLDIGCGTAPIARSVVAMGSHYEGIDFSAQMVEAAKRNTQDLLARGDVRLGVGDATKLDYPDNSFDAVTAMGLVEYLSRDQINCALREMRRILRPGGVAVLTIPKFWSWGRVVLGLLYPLRMVARKLPYRKNIKLKQQEEFRRLYLNPGELDRACGNVGLHKLGVSHYNVLLLSSPATLLAPRFCYLVNRPFEGLARIPGGDFLATGYIGLYQRE